MLTQPAVAGTGSLAELHLRIYYHRWGGVAGRTKCNIRLSLVSLDMGRDLSLAELDQLGLQLCLNWSLEDFPGWWWGGGVGWGWGKAGNKAKAQLQLGLGLS